MAKLTPSQRAKAPKGLRDGYPMPDKLHARLAKSGASHALHVGNISRQEEEEVDAKANRILKKGR